MHDLRKRLRNPVWPGSLIAGGILVIIVFWQYGRSASTHPVSAETIDAGRTYQENLSRER